MMMIVLSRDEIDKAVVSWLRLKGRLPMNKIVLSDFIVTSETTAPCEVVSVKIINLEMTINIKGEEEDENNGTNIAG